MAGRPSRAVRGGQSVMSHPSGIVVRHVAVEAAGDVPECLFGGVSDRAVRVVRGSAYGLRVLAVADHGESTYGGDPDAWDLIGDQGSQRLGGLPDLPGAHDLAGHLADPPVAVAECIDDRGCGQGVPDMKQTTRGPD